jgi:2-polyprenyl-3-methyl-5-hydroxy-6-metoxy-1,4-benzoquinol methylase
MPDNVVENYGWQSSRQPQSTDYIAPKIRALAKQLQATRVADLGSGNGSICGQLAKDGYQVVGIEYDKSGVEIAMAAYPNLKVLQPRCAG